MAVYIMWIAIGILFLTLIIGLCMGLIRGLKRSSLHIVFMLASFVIALLVTKPVTEMILQINIPVDGTNMPLNEYIASMIEESLDVSNFASASSFIENMPAAIVSPILFILTSLIIYFVCSIIYLVVARISFGKKKEDFKKNKPHRWFGGLVGMVEAFLFMFLIFAPLTSLTKTYQEIAELPTETASSAETSDNMKTIAELLNESMPSAVNEIILAYNDSVIGKVASVGGIDNAIFDKLSNFEVDGEEISFREEVVSLVDVYDDVVVTYNNINAKNYSQIDLSNLKVNIEKFLDNGIFKAVLSNTVKDFVLKFDYLNMTDAPQTLIDIVDDLQTTFSAENFDVHAYLKHDILKLVDTADVLFKSGILEAYEDLETKDLEGVLSIVDSKSEKIETIAENVLSLNLVSDTFNTILELASDGFEEAMSKDETLEISLNTNVEKTALVADLMTAVNEVIAITDYIDLSEISNSENILSTFTEVENLDGLLVQAGKALDAVRELDILILPVEEGVRDEKVYVFDNILKSSNIQLLGDEVYKNLTDTKTTKIDSYTTFFDYIKSPMNILKELGVFEENLNFDTLLDKMLIGLKQNESMISGLLLPFYQLDDTYVNTTLENKQGTLKYMIFDNVVDMLATNTNSLLSFDEVKNLNNLSVWNQELKYIGKTLNNLNTGKIGADEKTYIKYMLSADADLQAVLKDMVNTDIDDQTEGVQTNFKATMKNIFDAKVFANLENTIFDTIDDSIKDFTGVEKSTDKTNLAETQDNVLTTIESMMSIILNVEEGHDMTLSQVGQLMDVLKTNAYNETAKDGVFNNVFCNIICYLTGENLNAVPYIH